MFLNLPLSGPEIHEEFFKGLNITTRHKKNFTTSISNILWCSSRTASIQASCKSYLA
ncbi:unnamed protein product [Prunus brigantina]